MKKRRLTYLMMTVAAATQLISGCGDEDKSATDDKKVTNEQTKDKSTDKTENKDADKQTGEETDSETNKETQKEEPTTENQTTPETEGTTNSTTAGQAQSEAGSQTTNNNSSNTNSNNANTDNNNSNNNSAGQNTNDELKTQVDRILSKIITPNMSELGKVLAIHDYITYNIDYDYSNYLSNTIPATSYSPLGALQTGWAVCEGYATLFYEMASAAGLEVSYVIGISTESGQGHAWNQVKVGGRWYNIDVTWDDPTFSGKEHNDHSSNSYWQFMVSDATFMASGHSWNTGGTHSCQTDIGEREMYDAMKELNSGDKVFFAESESDIDNAIAKMKEKGVESCDIYTCGMGDYSHMYTLIEKYAAKNKTSYTAIGGSDTAIVKLHIVKDKNIVPVCDMTELGSQLKSYTGTYEDMRIRYYNEDIANRGLTEYCIGTGLLYELARAGISADAGINIISEGSYASIRLAKKDEKVVIIDDLAKLATFGDEYIGYTVWYNGGAIKSENMYNAMYNAVIPKGKKLGIATGRNDEYYGVTSFTIGSIESVMYADNIDKVKEYGIENLKKGELYIPADETFKSQIYDYIGEALNDPSPSYYWHGEEGFFVMGFSDK